MSAKTPAAAANPEANTADEANRAEIRLPARVAQALGAERGTWRYRALYGGRGSGKSQGAATVAALWGYQEPLRILCVREFQASIAESFYAELEDAITRYPFLQEHYTLMRDRIVGKNGTVFIFKGLRRNSQSVKSLAKIDLTIVEEAEDVPEKSWTDLEATVFRQDKSELWAVWNPRFNGSPVDERFIKNPPPDAVVKQVNYSDNPFFPARLEALRARERERLDTGTYAHVWEGAYLENSEAQILADKVQVSGFKVQEKWDGPYYGLDFGFARDPSACVEAYIDQNTETLYINREAGGVGVEQDDLPALLTKGIDGIEEYTIRCDNSRPETISHIKKHGLPKAEAALKWSGSIEDGIAHLRSYRKIVVHSRCESVIEETRLYSYKVDRLTGEVKPDIVDAYNHFIDALRYALAPLIRRKKKRAGAF